jgi:hypothetical protein
MNPPTPPSQTFWSRIVQFATKLDGAIDFNETDLLRPRIEKLEREVSELQRTRGAKSDVAL